MYKKRNRRLEYKIYNHTPEGDEEKIEISYATMKIVKVKSCDDEDGTVEVTAQFKKQEVTFYVQTINGVFREDLGCLVSTMEYGDNLDWLYDYDIVKIVVIAEGYSQSQYKKKKQEKKNQKPINLGGFLKFNKRI